MKRWKRLGLAAGLAILLAACGGGGGGGSSTSTSGNCIWDSSNWDGCTLS